MFAEPLAIIPVANALGEGVVWDDRAQAFVWTDILDRKLYRLPWGSDTPVAIDVPDRLGSIALTDDPDLIVAAFASGFARFNLANGACDWLARPELPPGVRFNDGKTDHGGRFVAGTMVEDVVAAGGSDRGTLYRLEDDNSLSELLHGFHISNSLCWSPDGRFMYHADSPAQAITEYRYDESGVRYQKIIAAFDEGYPDGATVDASGRIWVALWSAGCVAVLDPAGARLMTVPVAASQPTCTAFGGPNLDVLAVTSARTELSDEELAEQPDAGALFLFQTNATGLPEPARALKCDNCRAGWDNFATLAVPDALATQWTGATQRTAAMAQPYLTLNRFGLGWRAGDGPPPRDGAAHLRAELTRYDPAPPVIAALPPRRTVVETLKSYRDEVRAGREAPPMSREADVMARDVRVHYLDAAAARMQQAAISDTPFTERLVHFWANHFAVSVQSLPVAVLAGDHENRAIRPHVMGKFGDMLKAAALHPAMLLFLDQAQSIGPGSPLAQRAANRPARGDGDAPRRLGLNENLAREILELHTLGVRSVYDQADVTAFARALTGWTVAGVAQRADRLLAMMGSRAEPGDAGFIDAMHEPGAQTILGKRFADGGRDQSLAVLDHLAVHPATARHIAIKLARHFAADTPPPALVTRLERAFLDSGGDLPTLYRALIAAPEAWQAAAPKFKTPWDWTVSMLRATGLKELPDRRGAVGALAQLGQPIWQPGSPAGFDDIADRWAGASGLMLRAELAARIAGGIASRTDPRAWGAAMMAGSASEATLTAISRADSPAQGVVLALMAPEFLRR